MVASRMCSTILWQEWLRILTAGLIQRKQKLNIVWRARWQDSEHSTKWLALAIYFKSTWQFRCSDSAPNIEVVAFIGRRLNKALCRWTQVKLGHKACIDVKDFLTLSYVKGLLSDPPTKRKKPKMWKNRKRKRESESAFRYGNPQANHVRLLKNFVFVVRLRIRWAYERWLLSLYDDAIYSIFDD